MDFFDDVLGGGGGNREEYRDFADRYDQGAPYDNIPDDEAMSRYQQMAPNLSPDDYHDSAREAFSRMEPEERQQFGRQLSDQASRQGYDFPGQDYQYGGQDQYGSQDERFRDPDYLAGITSQMHQQQPDALGGLLSGLMGGGSAGSGTSSNPLAKAAMSGIAAMAARKFMNQP